MCQVHLEKNAHCVTAAISGEFILGCTSEIKEKVKNYLISLGILDKTQPHDIRLSWHDGK